MPRMIFVNLPVADLPRARRFYEGIGFTNEPRFTDETAAAMQWSDTIFVMLLTHDKWRTFTDRPIPPADHSEVMNCLSFDSRDDVARMNQLAGQHGGTAHLQPDSDYGFMYSNTFADPDGHVWEAMWMDPAVAEGETHISEATS